MIERPAKNARITIYSARPGVVIGKKGEDIEGLRNALQKLMGVPVHVNIEEIRKPELDAQLIADSITSQLEKRVMFRRAMKRAMQNAMRLGAQGIKITSAGRLNGAEIARTEWYREGRVPLHTLRADIEYGFSEAKTTYGMIGVQVLRLQGRDAGQGRAARRAARPEPDKKPARKTRSETCCSQLEGNTARSRRAATRASPRAAPRCPSASSASRPSAAAASRRARSRPRAAR